MDVLFNDGTKVEEYMHFLKLNRTPQDIGRNISKGFRVDSQTRLSNLQSISNLDQSTSIRRLASLNSHLSAPSSTRTTASKPSPRPPRRIVHTMGPKTEIDLYSAGTPNGHKVHCLMEELGLNYTLHKIDISKNTQKEDWFLKINPNGRIPAIVDKTSGTPKRVFEGAAILLYLTAKYDPEHQFSFAYDTPEYWETVEWLVWMQSGVGPMQGQANHFYRYAPEKIPYGINRYTNETKRLYQVLEDRLASQRVPWIVGGKYTIADLACYSWINWAPWAGIDTSGFPRINAWVEAIDARPATQRGLNLTEKFDKKEKFGDKEKMDQEAKKASDWIVKSQKEDAEKHGQ